MTRSSTRQAVPQRTQSTTPAPPWLRAALAWLRLEAVEVQAIANEDPFSSIARTFLVVTGDGARLKARLGPSARSAERAQRLAARLDDPRIPVPVGRRGRVTLETWVDGATLSSLRANPAHIDAAADLLAFIHGFPGAPSRSLPQIRAVTPALAWISRAQEQLLAAEVLDPGLAQEVSEIVRLGLPERARWGLTHNDLSPTNLVVDAGGRLISVDNEHLGWGLLDADLARAWLRWPTPTEAFRRFEARYQAQMDVELSQVARRAWRTAAALVSVGVRHRHGVAIDQPLARLREAVSGTGE
jgi:aminoglycoside phosphotransferase (APT) family kinase protein